MSPNKGNAGKVPYLDIFGSIKAILEKLKKNRYHISNAIMHGLNNSNKKGVQPPFNSCVNSYFNFNY